MGVQVPRVWCAPPAVSSRGREAIELARSVGLVLDPWQEFVLEHSLGVRADGTWAAFEVGGDVARQNGKGGVLEARELAGLFLWGERLLIHSAHEFPTSLEAFSRLEGWIDGCEDLSRQVKRVVRSHGEEGITLTSGQRIRFRTRTKGGGRGFTCDTLILDEAMFLPDKVIGALLPTLSARPNPQVWYTGSAVDQEIHEEGIVFSRIRERGTRGGDPRLAFFEWSAPFAHPDDVTDEAAADPRVWAQANPALGIRITEEHVEAERRSMDFRTFAAERLGVGDWPNPNRDEETVISLELWDALADSDSRMLDPVCLAFDVTPSRSRSAIGAAGRRDDDLMHVEVIEHSVGTGWLVNRLVDLDRKHQPAFVVCDAASPAASLVPELEAAGVTVTLVTARELARACGQLFDGVQDETVRHLGSRELRDAIKGALTRPLGDAWAWSRKSSRVDISPLVTVTLASWAAADARASSEVLVAFA